MFSHAQQLVSTFTFIVILGLVTRLSVALPAPAPAPQDQELESKVPRSAKVIRSCTVPNTAALTFDDGPSIYVNEVDKLLKDNDAKGTFFLNGNNWGCIYTEDNARRVKFLYDQGHQIASHTWAHNDLTTLTRSQLTTEMRDTNAAIQKITGVMPAYMRPPFGKYNDLVREVVADVGQSIVVWDFDSGDSTGLSVAQQRQHYDDVTRSKPITVLSLEHDVHVTSVRDVLPHAIQKLKAAGYKLVTLSECLGGTEPYLSVGPSSPRDASWKC